MSIKSFASKQFSTHLLDERRLDKARARAERERRHRGEPHRIEFFHQVDDPYSHLLAQALVKLQERYDVEVVTWLVEPPEDWAAPARALLESYSLVDARRLAEKGGFHAVSAKPPSRESVVGVQRQLAATLEAPEEPGAAATLEAAVVQGKALWSGEPVGATEGAATEATLQTALRAGTERRAELGHYLGGTCFYGGEWTWGIDRLAYLEERLADLGARIPPAADAGQRAGAPTGGAPADGAPTQGVPIYSQPRLLEEPVPAALADLPDLHFFASFRSPYTWISTERVIRLAEAFNVNLRIRFVLPMVMRGLPVKRAKRVYILLDAAREARRNGVKFGPISDPVGKPVERGDPPQAAVRTGIDFPGGVGLDLGAGSVVGAGG